MMREGRQRTQAVYLALCDALMVLLAMQIAWWLRFDANQWLAENGFRHPFDVGWTPKHPYLLAVFVTLPIFWLILREMNLYAEPEDAGGEFFRLSAAASVAGVLLAALSFFIKLSHEDQQFQYSRAYSMIFLPVSIACLFGGRVLFRKILRALAQRGVWQNRILFVGTGPLAEELAKILEARGTNKILGTLLIHDSNDSGTLNVVGQASELSQRAEELGCDEIIVAVPDAPPGLIKKLAEDCYRSQIRFRMVPDVYEMLLDHMNLSLVGDIPLLGMRGSRIEGINLLIKRLFDIVVSIVLLIVLAPTVFLVTAIGIKLSDSGPVFYYQERIGYRRRKFRFWKFRSMKIGADQAQDVEQHKDYLKKYIGGSAESATGSSGEKIFKITEDPRVTPFGRFIRKFSIDELPQLWNVLRGDMSLIGPRPPIAYEVENYRPIHMRRFEVLPGISGLWQVSGRNRLNFEEMVKLDLYYIENWSLELDVRIMFKTVSVVLFQRAY